MAERGDPQTEAPGVRLAKIASAALGRRSAHEGLLAGALRELAPREPALREAAAAVMAAGVRRRAVDRALFVGAAGGLAAAGDPRAAAALAALLAGAGCGGVGVLAAAAWCRDSLLAEPLARAATDRQPSCAFAAEVARCVRGEADGRRLAELAPKIKEAHRLELCAQVFVPLRDAGGVVPSLVEALAVLRDTERHIGRWLVLAELASRAGDAAPGREAAARSHEGADSARTAWAYAAWALGAAPAPPVRPTLELMARLSDRPSSERDLSFLFRVAGAGLAGAQGMLGTLVGRAALADAAAVRAAFELARGFGRSELARPLEAIVADGKREPLRGCAAAALVELGASPAELAQRLARSRHPATLAWAALLSLGPRAGERVVTEQRFRRLQLGSPA
ncbi:MAG: hypothetical protein IT376_04115 [Polyangiaceae bacterium]|nr:hypothetical protein [Polyangiaceae bacterium]